MRLRVGGSVLLASSLALAGCGASHRAPDCARRVADDASAPGYVWSVTCDVSGYPRLAGGQDGGVALRLISLEAGEVNLGGASLVVDANSEVVARFDGDGHHVWSELVRPATATSPLVQTLPDGGVALGLEIRGPFDFGGRAFDAVEGVTSTAVVALAPDGRPRWSRIFSAAGPESTVGIESLATSADGSIAVHVYTAGPLRVDDEGPFGDSGNSIALFDVDGSLQRVVDAPLGLLIDLADDGSLLLDRGAEGFAVLDPDGSPRWDRVLDAVFRGRFSPSGDLVIAGALVRTLNLGGDDLVKTDYLPDFGNSSVFVARYSAAGEHEWSLSLDEDRGVYELDVDSSEVLTLVTYLSDDRARIIRLDEAGQLSDERTTRPLNAHLAAILPDGDVVLTGTAEEPFDLGGGVEPFSGPRAVWLVKYAR
ncbi:MAG: hypothetical protein R3B09_06685 [Nannocystaceae bacterium]